MIVIGVDPGTGVSSPTAVVAFNSVTKALLMEEIVDGGQIEKLRRARWIAQGFADCLEHFKDPEPHLVVFENFVMKGPGGQTLQRLLGALEAQVPEHAAIQHVGNTTMKKLVGGHGDSDKEKVAVGVLKWFATNAESTRAIKQFIIDKDWDLTDALGIGIAGLMQEVGSDC